MTVPTPERSLERSPCPLVYLCRSLSPLSVPVGWSLVLTGVPDDLLAVLGAVEDRRAPRGVRHNLVTVLAIEVCAVLAGVRPFTAIAEWANDLPVGVRARLSLRRKTPSGHCQVVWRSRVAGRPSVVTRV